MNLKTTVVFNANYLSTAKVRVNQGGTASGKTVALLQCLFSFAQMEPGTVITVVGQDIPNLKRGAYRDAKWIYNSDESIKQVCKKPNETDRIFNFLNGSLIEFTSYDSEQDAKSGKRHYLFVNEANGIPYNIYWQLFIRTSKVTFIDYNPTCRFWVHDKLIGTDNVELIISDHRHNPFLTKEQHEQIESIQDPELFKVYARGLTGKIEGLVFNNWSLCDKMPETPKKHFVGVDFGFTNDPTGIIEVAVSEGQLWLNEIVYCYNLTNPEIAQVINKNHSGLEVICDSAEPKSIQELRMQKIRVIPAVKGKDSINFGISVMKRYKINITRTSLNLKKEFERYKWKTDSGGNTLNIPIDQFNHGIDAVRYVCQTRLQINTGIKVISLD